MKKVITYKNNLVNFSSSLAKALGGKYYAESNRLVDLILEKKYKHIAVILLDGLGMSIINKHCSQESIFKTCLIQQMNSVYPPTTPAATTSFLTGLEPLETGWLGWHLYLDDQNPSVILFRNQTYLDQKPFNGYLVNDKIPFTYWFDSLKKATSYSIWPPFKEGGYKTFDEEVEALKENLNKDETNFTYLYYVNPDYLIHTEGVDGVKVHNEIKHLEEVLTELQESLTEDDAVFVIADHGLVDIDKVYIKDYPNITKYLKKDISGDTRFVQFYLKDLKKVSEFKAEFIKTFGECFKLYTKHEFIKSGLSGKGNIHPTVEYSLGDVIAVAVDSKAFILRDEDPKHPQVAHHAGLTDDEMKIPLILIRKKIYGKPNL